jgi:transposase-like protein
MTHYRTRFKARAVLMAADGVATRAIAREVDCAIGTAAKWRVRYVNDRAIEPCD